MLFETVRALQRENTDVLYASLVKDTMRRKRPSFSESAYGYESFGEMLEEARDAGFITLREDERSGTWVVCRWRRNTTSSLRRLSKHLRTS